MLIAEINHKVDIIDDSIRNKNAYISRMEDVLTSNIFGILKNIDLKIFNLVIEEAGINLLLKDKPIFRFWDRYSDQTEPDLIIETESVYIVIEIKYLSDFDRTDDDRKSQLIRELNGAMNERRKRDLYFLAITREDSIDWYKKIKPNETEELKKYIDKLHHISWSKIYEILKSFDRKKIDNISINFLNDLVNYLENKGIGYTKPQVSQKSRDFEYFFGKNSINLIRFLEEIVSKNEKITTYRRQHFS
ncbi:MAG: hypothetical protein IEMM0008_1552 [bacterium]|nr:MAG: hypothetical protein IEMM0008_1552 [bacterium]